MTDAERALLLTVARVLRARIKEDPNDPSGSNRMDYDDLCEALASFDPLPGHGGDFAQAQG